MDSSSVMSFVFSDVSDATSSLQTSILSQSLSATTAKSTTELLKTRNVKLNLRELHPKEDYNVKWVHDVEVAGCMCCHKKFTFAVRRHHCRQCGSVVCSACSLARRRVKGLLGLQRVCKECIVNGVYRNPESGDVGFSLQANLQAVSERALKRNEYRHRMIAFYSEHAPAKLSSVDKLIHKYEDNLEEMLVALYQKYGVAVPTVDDQRLTLFLGGELDTVAEAESKHAVLWEAGWGEATLDPDPDRDPDAVPGPDPAAAAAHASGGDGAGAGAGADEGEGGGGAGHLPSSLDTTSSSEYAADDTDGGGGGSAVRSAGRGAIGGKGSGEGEGKGEGEGEGESGGVGQAHRNFPAVFGVTEVRLTSPEEAYAELEWWEAEKARRRQQREQRERERALRAEHARLCEQKAELQRRYDAQWGGCGGGGGGGGKAFWSSCVVSVLFWPGGRCTGCDQEECDQEGGGSAGGHNADAGEAGLGLEPTGSSTSTEFVDCTQAE